MSDILKVLGQANPAATTETTLYTVPANTQTTVSSLTICNRENAAHTFRVSVSPGGGATSNEDYLYYDHSIAANDTIHITIGMTLGAGDIVRVYCDAQQLSFNLFGVESD